MINVKLRRVQSGQILHAPCPDLPVAGLAPPFQADPAGVSMTIGLGVFKELVWESLIGLVARVLDRPRSNG